MYCTDDHTAGAMRVEALDCACQQSHRQSPETFHQEPWTAAAYLRTPEAPHAGTPPSCSKECPHMDIAPHMQTALALLLQAHEYAAKLGCNNWQFAVEMNTFRDIGLSKNDLRWLLLNEYVQHAWE